MTKYNSQKMLDEWSEWQKDSKIGRKMFKETYVEELKRLQTIKKTLRGIFSSEKLVTEGEVSKALFGIARELEGLLNQNHSHHIEDLKTNDRIVQAHLAIKMIFSILDEVAKVKGLKSLEKKIQKLQKFDKAIINKVKKKAESRSKIKPLYIQ
jgi:hypothetical protein